MMIPLSIEILGYAMLQTIQALFFFLVIHVFGDCGVFTVCPKANYLGPEL